MSLQRVKTPRTDGGSYIVNRLDGEVFTMPGTQGAFRMWATQKQTGNTISVFGWDGPASDQTFHYHKATHDVFLITEGLMKVYCDDRCKILGPGDFCSVPPGYLHKPTPLGPIVKAVPLITPAAWVDFFRRLSDSFDGIMFPEADDRSFGDAISQLPSGWEEAYDTYLQDVPNPAEPLPFTEEDTILPDGLKPYYLRHNSGPKWALGGVTSRPFITTAQSAGKFAVSIIESSDVFASSVFDHPLSFPSTHHVLLILDGPIEVSVHGEAHTVVNAGEVVFLPANTPFSLRFKSKYVRFYSYASGDGIEAFIQQAGQRLDTQALPDKALDLDETAITKAIGKLGIKI